MLGGPSESLESFLFSFIRFFRLVTITFLIFGGLAWFISWTKTRILSLHGSRGEELPAMVLSGYRDPVGGRSPCRRCCAPSSSAGPGKHWAPTKLGAWKGLRRGGEFSGIYFVPVFGILLAPALGVMTALAFIAGAAASLGYLLMGLEGSPRVLIRSICL